MVSMVFHEQMACLACPPAPHGLESGLALEAGGMEVLRAALWGSLLPFKTHHPQVRPSFLTKNQSGVVPAALGVIIVPAGL